MSAPLLAALWALCHRVGLTAEEAAEVERGGTTFSPALWRETKRLLRDADRGADGTHLELGFTGLLVRWLGHRDEGAFAGAFGAGVAEALARALAVFEWPPRRRVLLRALVAESEACGDEVRAAPARRALEEVDRALAVHDATAMYRAAATLLTILWCIAHDEGLLAAERGLDPGIERSPETWTRVRAAHDAGRPGDVPLPVQTFDAWSASDGLEEVHLRVGLEEAHLRVGLEEAVRAHPDLPRMVELLWERPEPDENVSREAAWNAVDAAFRRRLGAERDYRPLPGERVNVYFEVNQGARRPEALERVALMRRLHVVLSRCGNVDPMMIATVYLDLAMDCESRGEPEATRRYLVAAVEQAQRLEGDSERRDCAEIYLAQWHLRSGEADEAVRRLERLEGPRALDALRLIEAKAPEREALRVAEGKRMRCADVRSACGVVFAELRAGNYLAAERLARELCDESPDSPHA